MRRKAQRHPRCKHCGEDGHKSRGGKLWEWLHFNKDRDKDHKFESDDSKVPRFLK